MKTANRKFSRLMACVLVFLLALTAAFPVFAAPTNVDQDNLQVVIHNNDGLPGMSTNQFTVYQLFTGTPNKEKEQGNDEYGADNWNNYTFADVKWGESITDNGEALLERLQSVNDDWAMEGGENIFKSVTDAAGLAKLLENHNTNNFLQHFATTVATVSNLKAVSVTPDLHDGDTDAEDYLTYTFTQPGYYMFADTHILSNTEPDAHSEYILAVLGDQEINLKASVPQVDKEIVGSDNTVKGDVAGVSDYVQFKLTGTLPQNFADFDIYKYIFHDTLSKGLTYVNDEDHPLIVTVYPTLDDADANRNGVTIPATYTTGVNYTVTDAEGASIDCSLEVSFDDLTALQNATPEPIAVDKNSVFVVTYYAQVNEDAVILDDGNPNTVLLEYSNDPNHNGTGKTKEKTVYVYAFGLDLTKVGNDTAHSEGLEGAGFVLKDDDGNYAIFEEQWVVNVTAEDGTRTQTFYKSKEAAEEAKGTGEVSGPVRRLTGWTSETSKPDTTDDVAGFIEAYKNAKKDLDKAKKKQQADAVTALQNAKDKLTKYLLEAGKGSGGQLPDVYGLDEGKYKLEEFIIPDGYNTPAEDFDINIDATINESTNRLEQVAYTHAGKTTTYKADAESDDLIARFHSGLLKDSIENQKAPFLPFTGGIGTLIFYVLGIALIVGAVTYLVIASKKRKKAEENA